MQSVNGSDLRTLATHQQIAPANHAGRLAVNLSPSPAPPDAPACRPGDSVDGTRNLPASDATVAPTSDKKTAMPPAGATPLPPGINGCRAKPKSARPDWPRSQ